MRYLFGVLTLANVSLPSRERVRSGAYHEQEVTLEFTVGQRARLSGVTILLPMAVLPGGFDC